MKKNRKKNVYTILVVILLIIFLVFLLSYRAYVHYSVWKSHHNYFKNPNQKIESWMSPRMISRGFNIPMSEIFGVMRVNASMNRNTALDRFCKEYRENCTELVERLNTLAGK